MDRHLVEQGKANRMTKTPRKSRAKVVVDPVTITLTLERRDWSWLCEQYPSSVSAGIREAVRQMRESKEVTK